MENPDTEKSRYPIGKHGLRTRYDKDEIETCIGEIEMFPARLRAKVERLMETELEKRYRSGGWTVRQVVHHVHDSHLQSYTRFKWALTEDKPLIKAYHEERWAELSDYRLVPIELSLRGLEAMHARWAAFMRTMDEASFHRSFVHPETGKEQVLFDRLAMYAWHGKHHLAHIELALRT
ncbi:MAG: YfiT family bacillithiol transferase [Fibrobacteria bacterium]